MTIRHDALDEVIAMLTAIGGEDAPPIIETPAEEAEAFGDQCATRQVRAAWWDLAYEWSLLPGVGEDAIVSRLASLGLTPSRQATWSVYCPPAVLGHFCAPETSTREELALWAALTISYLHQRGDLIEDPSTGQLYPADRSNRS